MGFETDSLVSSSIPSKRILGIEDRRSAQVSRTKTIRGLGIHVIIYIYKKKIVVFVVVAS